ncbi:MAG TPA: malonate decarboxylase ACP synthase, partial [Telluria sp.]|nr:malonate decarboxylase ACP synthase [Telluria sp.]
MFSRHDLVWLGDSAWAEALGQVPPSLRGPIEQWQRAGWPAVVRRREAHAGEGEVCVGIPLPPDPVTRIKPRVGLRLGVGGIDRHCAPLSLTDTLVAAPQAWREPLSALATHGLRAYGSLA